MADASPPIDFTTMSEEALAVLHDESSMEISERAFAAGRWDTYLCPFSDLGTFFKTPWRKAWSSSARTP